MIYTRDDFSYVLPEELIARYPLANRRDSRLLVVDKKNNQLKHQFFSQFMDYVGDYDIVVLNNTQVIPARFFGYKSTGGKVEFLIERILDEKKALAHIKTSKKPKRGQKIQLEEGHFAVINAIEVLVEIELEGERSWFQYLDSFGHMPIPPYFKRDDEMLDQSRYQTVFAEKPGAVASPTASLHIDEALFEALKPQLATITLHVGAGTFQSVRDNDLSQHQMHYEWLDVPEETIEKIKLAKARGGRVIAVGTTVARALETAATHGDLQSFQGETNLFITPGYDFKVIDKLLTNFHLPESTLIMLVSAFAGFDLTQKAYQEAIQQSYRFFSYGDAMLVI